MVIKEIDYKDCDEDNFGYELRINDDLAFFVSNDLAENPEDAYLFRDLHFVYKIKEWMYKAYEAGKDGDLFIVKRESKHIDEV